MGEVEQSARIHATTKNGEEGGARITIGIERDDAQGTIPLRARFGIKGLQ